MKLGPSIANHITYLQLMVQHFSHVEIHRLAAFLWVDFPLGSSVSVHLMRNLLKYVLRLCVERCFVLLHLEPQEMLKTWILLLAPRKRDLCFTTPFLRFVQMKSGKKEALTGVKLVMVNFFVVFLYLCVISLVTFFQIKYCWYNTFEFPYLVGVVNFFLVCNGTIWCIFSSRF